MSTRLGRAVAVILCVTSIVSGKVPTAAAQSGPDLAPVRVVGPAAAWVGDSMAVTVVTKNGGTRDVSATWVLQVLLSADATITATDEVLARLPVSRVIRAGARDSATVRVLVPAATRRGAYYVGVQVDVGNAIVETSEVNNLGGSSSATAVDSRWDLTVGPVSLPDSLKVGSSLALSIPVRNLGTGAVPGGWVGRVYFSKDAAFSSDDRYLGDFPFPQPLAPGGTVQVPLSYPAQPWGDWHVLTIVDGDNIRGESGEGNNIVASPTKLHVWPEFVNLVASIDVPPQAFSESEWSETFPVKITVKNLGTIASSGILEVKFFLSDNNNIKGMLEIPQDVEIGSVTDSRSIPAGGDISRVVNVTIPTGLAPTVLASDGRPLANLWYLGAKLDPSSGENEPYRSFQVIDWLPSTSPPASPGSLSAIALPGSQVQLSWTDNSSDEGGFLIKRGKGSGSGCLPFDVLAVVGANVTSYLDHNLTPSTAYCYQVYAINSSGSSPLPTSAAGVLSMP